MAKSVPQKARKVGKQRSTKPGTRRSNLWKRVRTVKTKLQRFSVVHNAHFALQIVVNGKVIKLQSTLLETYSQEHIDNDLLLACYKVEKSKHDSRVRELNAGRAPAQLDALLSAYPLKVQRQFLNMLFNSVVDDRKGKFPFRPNQKGDNKRAVADTPAEVKEAFLKEYPGMWPSDLEWRGFTTLDRSELHAVGDCIVTAVGCDAAGALRLRAERALREALTCSNIPLLKAATIEELCHLLLGVPASEPAELPLVEHNGQQLGPLEVHHSGHPQGSGDAVQGSTFADRIFVPIPAARGLLVGLCRKAGISPQALSELRAHVAELPEGAPARTLWPFLEEQHMVEGAGPGNVAAPLKWRALLHGLGTDAPVCQLLRPGGYAVVDQLLQPSTVLADDQRGLLESTCLVLFRFLQPDLQRPLPDAVRNLLAAMREVSERAFTPAPSQQQQARQRQPAGGGSSGDGGGQAAGATCGERNYIEALADGLPAAGDWGSRDEFYCRSGQWGGPPTRDEWHPTGLGGSHVLRALPLYAKDSQGRRSCTKHKDQSGVLTPGRKVHKS